jgi:Holliday junction resolvase-like predicted endonuclease
MNIMKNIQILFYFTSDILKLISRKNKTLTQIEVKPKSNEKVRFNLKILDRREQEFWKQLSTPRYLFQFISEYNYPSRVSKIEFEHSKIKYFASVNLV